ncbi:uncharacterized protein LOC126682568 [Mercurialis annua]|uniref:uncharacterized protein LOC126682568 n=1 Tax=Mercurialis annua TaxID=3986 RepID=UPI0021600EC8|nr:uncharacterized protein LOC126682568 [Mercurialis annua]
MASLLLQNSLISSFTQKPTALFSFNSTNQFKVSFSLSQSSDESAQNPPEKTTPEPLKLAFEKAKAYKKSIEETKKTKLEENPVEGSAEDSGYDKVKAALEKAKEYRKNKGLGGGEKGAAGSVLDSGLKGNNGGNLQSGIGEKSAGSKEKFSVSSIDFMGLNFADKKSGRGLPAGLVPLVDPFQGGDVPEVEIIVGDNSKFRDKTVSMPKPSQDDSLDVYKPKVSTWGVFPRPGNISKTFGGGRTIRPGDVLETAEERAAKNDRTKQLLAAYKKKMGISIDPKLKLECDEAFKNGDSLMDSGKLKEAMPYFQTVMDKLPFQSELHGLAALQWSICQDSISSLADGRKEAQSMYEKLQSHPNAKVSKKARQFLFSFQAMEMMKVRGSDFIPNSTDYQDYFEAFVEKKTNYLVGEAESAEGAVPSLPTQALPYMFFLVSPIFLILFMAISKGNIN